MTPTYILIASCAPLIRLPDTIRHHLRLLERFHQHCLGTILNIRWSDFVANTEVLELAEVISIEAMVLKLQLRWAGHVSRMEKYHLHRIVLYGELPSGYPNIGAPRKRYKGFLKKSLTACCIDHRQWATQAADRDSWRRTVHLTIWRYPQGQYRGHKEKKEKTRPSSTHPGLDLYLQLLWQDLPVPHRPRQPPACL